MTAPTKKKKRLSAAEVILGISEAAKILQCDRSSLEKWESLGLVNRVGSDLYGKPMFLMSHVLEFSKVRPRRGRPPAQIQVTETQRWTA